MNALQLVIGTLTILTAGCANFENPFDNANHDMLPLEGTAPPRTIKNRFPEERGGLPLSRADREDHEMTPIERLKQY